MAIWGGCMEYFDKIILFFSCIFEVYIFHDFFRAYFEFRGNKQILGKRVTAGFLAVLCLLVVNTYGNTIINLAGSLIIIWVYFTVVFQADFGSRILYFLIAFLAGLGCEFLFAILLSIPAYIGEQSSVVKLSDIPWHIFTMKLLTYILFAMIKQFFGHSKKTVNNQIFIYYLCIPIASLGIMLLTYYSGIGSSVQFTTKALLSVCFAVMLFGNIFVFSAFNRYSDGINTNAEQKLIIARQAMDLQYYNQFLKLDNQYRDFIHNTSHYLKIIGEMARENKNEKIISILQDLNVELESSISTIYCNNSVINSILSGRKSVAEKNGVNLDIYVEPGADLANISDADIITMMNNLLDNAIQAARTAENKSVIVRMYLENAGSFYIIKIKNGYGGVIKRTDSGFQSTKNEKGLHGIGIKSVEHTAEKYNGYLECFAEDKIFTAVLVLPSYKKE